MQSKLIAVLTSAALALASPLEVRGASGTEGVIPTTAGRAIGGALDQKPSPTPAGGQNLAALQRLTIQVTNRHTKAVSTAHAANAGAPTPISGHVGPGVLAVGASDSFVVPPGWAGNVALVESQYAITGDDSLIEASFINSNADVDISYVDGFSVPVTCSCSGQVVTGCNKNIDALSRCPNNDGQGACVNPKRADTGTSTAAPYFAPCQGAAYTFPNDNGANSFGQCQNGVISCCVGTACPANPKQPK